ncbi:hypothetical protein [Desertimonas flava]|uniref:hypothetical protein n=1 Tax=Desertimonas flava TaxID=2064846 RepID=UPI000E35611A|nr:hypothetical protein [Desertimonas flava]
MAALAVVTHWSHFVPVLALVFTVASFWWIYVRRGKLKTFAPNGYGSVFLAKQARLRFPLVLTNTGAPSIAVEDLRAVVDGNVLEWLTTRATLRPEAGDRLDLAKPFAVAGRSAVQLVPEFGQSGEGAWQPGDGPCVMRLEWRDRGRWRELLTFQWWPPASNRGAYIAHRNAPNAEQE